MATATDKDELLVSKVFNHICDHGVVVFKDLLKKPSPLACRRFSPETFKTWMKEHLSTDSRFEVREIRGKLISVKIRSKVRICSHYVTRGKCKFKKECKCWHVCKDYVDGRCDKPCPRSLSHDFWDAANADKTTSLGCGRKLPTGAVKRIVAVNLLQVCSEYVRLGSCEQTCCPHLHVCAGFVAKTCLDDSVCGRSHNLRSRRNRLALKNHGFQWSSGESDEVICNILVSSATLASQKAAGERKGSEEDQHVDNKTVNEPANQPLHVPDTARRETAVSADHPAASASLHRNISGPSFVSEEHGQISERRVFECICKEYKCSVKFSELCRRRDLFPKGQLEAEDWFKCDARENSFLIRKGNNGELLQISAFSPKLRLCFNGSNCSKDDCKYFHVCRKYIAGNCTSSASCQHKHEVRNEKDLPLLSNLKSLSDFSEEQLRCLFRVSMPQVCLDYNSHQCAEGSGCGKVHVCKDFVSKVCWYCGLDHEAAFDSSCTKAVAEKLRMSVAVLKKTMIVPTEEPAEPSDLGHIHQEDSVLICSDFILGHCSDGARCVKHHCEAPHQWQFRDPRAAEQKWKSSNDDRNFEYYYVGCSGTEKLILDSPFHGVRKNITMVVNYEEMTMTWPPASHYPIQLRRLSTESHVVNPSNPAATKWRWFWQDEDERWQEYGDKSSKKEAVQIAIEIAFLDPSRSSYEYSTPKHSYTVYFRDKAKGRMYQKNKHYGTERNVRRRPGADQRVIQKLNGNQLESAKSSNCDDQQSIISSHWTRISPETKVERITLSRDSQEFLEVRKRFYKTMPEDEKVIMKIQRVQNPYMWDRFQRKKESMKKKFYGSILERELFHGTGPNDVDKICKQNFDWRLHGKNATMFGAGSYFALKASYSDRYSCGTDGGSCRFMFLANVLVGSYTKGDSSMRRPPPKDPSNPTSDLFDSCVNDEYKPVIFVVFEMDQCYPSYVIEYVSIPPQPEIFPDFASLASARKTRWPRTGDSGIPQPSSNSTGHKTTAAKGPVASSALGATRSAAASNVKKPVATAPNSSRSSSLAAHQKSSAHGHATSTGNSFSNRGSSPHTNSSARSAPSPTSQASGPSIQDMFPDLYNAVRCFRQSFSCVTSSSRRTTETDSPARKDETCVVS